MNRRRNLSPCFNSIRDLHQKMVIELSSKIFPSSDDSGTQHTWKCFIESLLFSKVEKERLKDMFDVFNALLEKDEIDYGEYSFVKGIFNDLNLIACRKIIEKYEEEMSKIQQGAKSDKAISRTGHLDAISVKRNERMKSIHSEMVSDLDSKIKQILSNQDQREFFRQFTKMLLIRHFSRLCDLEINNIEDVFEIFQLLVDKEIIRYGQYDTVNNIFTRMRKYELLQIVAECEEKLAVPHNLEVVDIKEHSVLLHFIPGLQDKCVFEEWIAEAEEISNPHWKEVCRVGELVSPIKIQNLLAYVHYRLRLRAENSSGLVLASEPSSVFQTLRNLKRRRDDEEGVIHSKVFLTDEQPTQTSKEYIYTILMENYNKCFQKILELPPDQLLPSIGKLTDEYERIFEMIRRFEQDGLRISNASKGSLEIAFYYRTSDSLYRLWNMYSSGMLRDVLQEGLITKHVLNKCKLDHIRLEVYISEEEYKNCLSREELQEDASVDIDTVEGFTNLEIGENDKKEQIEPSYENQGCCNDERGAMEIDKIKNGKRGIQAASDRDFERDDDGVKQQGMESNKTKDTEIDSSDDKQGVQAKAPASDPRTMVTYHKTIGNRSCNDYSKALSVVAIDIGTTHSGYAYSFKRDFENDPLNIYTLQSNSGGFGLITYRIPTAILLTPDKKLDSFGYDAENYFSELQFEDKHQNWYFFRGFKMTVYNKTQMDIHRDTKLKDFTGKSLPAMLVFTKAIEYFKEAATKRIANRMDDFDETHVKWVLTVPTIWSDAAKQFMREAAENAGIQYGKIALETECAAIYCKYQHIEGQACGDKYLTMDCGGGTLDCTVHEVGSNGLKELYAASGGDFGGDKVNVAFEQLFNEKVLQQLRQKYLEDYMDLCRAFEMKKICFSRTSNIIYVAIPLEMRRLVSEIGENVGDIFNHSFYGNKVELRNGKARIPLDVFEGLFGKVVNGIVSHVSDILIQHTNVNTIFMVGGFSRSSILQDEVRKHFPSIKLIVPDNPGLAVVKGGVIFGHCP